MEGMARKTMARLHPKTVVKNPKVRLPHNAPIFVILPTQLTCTLDKGPVSSGVSSDSNFGNAGENHPMIHLFFFSSNEKKIIWIQYWIFFYFHFHLALIHQWKVWHLPICQHYEICRNRCIILSTSGPLEIDFFLRFCHDRTDFLPIQFF